MLVVFEVVIRAMFTPTLSTEGQISPSKLEQKGHNRPQNKNLEPFWAFHTCQQYVDIGLISYALFFYMVVGILRDITPVSVAWKWNNPFR